MLMNDTNKKYMYTTWGSYVIQRSIFILLVLDISLYYEAL